MSVIEVKNLNFKYPRMDYVLKNINLQVEEGEFVSIIGENGSGKSTLIKCIVDLIKNYEGEIIKGAQIGYLPQKTEIQTNFPASIEEVVLSGTISNAKWRMWYNKSDREKANNIMQELGIYEIRKTCFGDLSGGQQQRVLIARALCSTTDNLIVLDEPVNGLDPNIAKQIYELLKSLNEEKKLTVLMVSHDVDRAVNYCDRVIEIKSGEVVKDCTSAEFLMQGGAKQDDTNNQ